MKTKKTVSKEIENIVAFYESLNEELENFSLPLEKLIQSKILISEKMGGKIAGIAGLGDKNLLFLVVKKEFQNQKLGQKLLAKVITLAKHRKYHFIALNVFASNVRALHIYKKFGFKIVTSNIMNSRKNYFMVLPLDLRGCIYEALLKLYFKCELYFVTHLYYVRRLWLSVKNFIEHKTKMR